MRIRGKSIGAIIGMVSMLGACNPRKMPVTVTAAVPDAEFQDFVDLKAGWRLRVVTPLLKSGGYRVHATDERLSGNTMTMSADANFLGYETSWYAANARRGGGIRIAFDRAETTIDGVVTPRERPTVALFQLPAADRFVRLLYVKRVSNADHDMAILAARREGLLTAIAGRVRENPSACKTERETLCEWIPAGISVLAEPN